MLRGCNYWDSDIPIVIEEKNFQIVNLCKFEHLSIDGSQYAQIIEESEEVIIQIFQVKDNQQLHSLRFPQIKNTKWETKIIFSLEYVICHRNSWISAQLYLHNFKINQGKYYFFELCQINKCFYLQDKFHILLCEFRSSFLLYEVESDFNLTLIAIKNIDKKDCMINQENTNPILLILLREEKKLLFLSNKLKTINNVVFKNQERFGMFGKSQTLGLKANFILMKDMFLIDQEKYSQMIVAQNRNGKRIRKIDFVYKQPFKFPIAVRQHYVFICLNICYLKVYDLKKGLMVGNLNLQDKGQIDNIKVTDDYFIIEINKVDWGWPIRKQK